MTGRHGRRLWHLTARAAFQRVHGGGYTQRQREKRMSNLKDAVRWPTPLTQDYRSRGPNSRQQGLADTVRKWPTPLASEAEQGYQRRIPGKKGKQQSLTTIVRDVTYPTPRTKGLCGGSGSAEMIDGLMERGVIDDRERQAMRSGSGGQLNPDWTEWLMGWPISWSRLEPMRKEDFDEWMEKARDGSLWDTDPADLPADDLGYIPRVTDEKAYRKERLMALGNGQVPSCVCLAEAMLQEGP